jgi:hypothetical protein
MFTQGKVMCTCFIYCGLFWSKCPTHLFVQYWIHATPHATLRQYHKQYLHSCTSSLIKSNMLTPFLSEQNAQAITLLTSSQGVSGSISTGKPTILTGVLRPYPQTRHENSWIVAQIRQRPLQSKSFPISLFTYHPTIWRFIYSEISIMPLNRT